MMIIFSSLLYLVVTESATIYPDPNPKGFSNFKITSDFETYAKSSINFANNSQAFNFGKRELLDPCNLSTLANTKFWHFEKCVERMRGFEYANGAGSVPHTLVKIPKHIETPYSKKVTKRDDTTVLLLKSEEIKNQDLNDLLEELYESWINLPFFDDHEVPKLQQYLSLRSSMKNLISELKSLPLIETQKDYINQVIPPALRDIVLYNSRASEWCEKHKHSLCFNFTYNAYLQEVATINSLMNKLQKEIKTHTNPSKIELLDYRKRLEDQVLRFIAVSEVYNREWENNGQFQLSRKTLRILLPIIESLIVSLQESDFT